MASLRRHPAHPALAPAACGLLGYLARAAAAAAAWRRRIREAGGPAAVEEAAAAAAARGVPLAEAARALEEMGRGAGDWK